MVEKNRKLKEQFAAAAQAGTGSLCVAELFGQSNGIDRIGSHTQDIGNHMRSHASVIMIQQYSCRFIACMRGGVNNVNVCARLKALMHTHRCTQFSEYKQAR